MQFCFQPERHRHQKRAQALRREGEISFQQPLEFQQRLVVENDVIQIFRLDFRLAQAEITAFFGKLWSCFFRAERYSCAAATSRPSTINAAALSW